MVLSLLLVLALAISAQATPITKPITSAVLNFYLGYGGFDGDPLSIFIKDGHITGNGFHLEGLFAEDPLECDGFWTSGANCELRAVTLYGDDLSLYAAFMSVVFEPFTAPVNGSVSVSLTYHLGGPVKKNIGDLNLDPTLFMIFSHGTGIGRLNFQEGLPESGTFEFGPGVPEPATMLLSALGLALLGLRRRQC